MGRAPPVYGTRPASYLFPIYTTTILLVLYMYMCTRSRAIQNRVLFGHIPLSMLEYIREIDAEAAATRRYLESMS